MAKGKNKLNKSNSSGWLDNYSEESAINEYQKGGEVKGKKSTLTKLKKALSLRENLGNLNTEEGYNTPLNQILRTAVGMEGKDLSNESMSPIAREQDAFRMYLGLPSRTGAFEQTGANKYRIRDYNKLYPDTLLSDESVRDWGTPYEDGVPDPVNKAFDLYPYDDFVMGKHYITKGKDAKGEYLRYYDKFDLDPTRRANQYIDRNINPRVGKYLKKATPILDELETLMFNPFELEDKVYYDPKTKLRSDIILQQNNQRVVPGQPVAIPDFAGGGKVNDPIYVNNPNDPRLRSYQDSTNAYINSIKTKNKIEKDKYFNFSRDYDVLLEGKGVKLPKDAFNKQKNNFKVYNKGTNKNMSPTDIIQFSGETKKGFAPKEGNFGRMTKNSGVQPSMITLVKNVPIYKKPTQPIIYKKTPPPQNTDFTTPNKEESLVLENYVQPIIEKNIPTQEIPVKQDFAQYIQPKGYSRQGTAQERQSESFYDANGKMTGQIIEGQYVPTEYGKFLQSGMTEDEYVNQIQEYAKGGKVKDNKGYLISNLDNFTPKKIINSNYITTNNMAFPVEANGVVLYPNTGDYIFPTDKVTEIPIMQGGGRTNLPKSIPNDPLLSPGQYQQLNSLQNFKKYIESDKSKKNLEDYKKSEILRKIQENQASVSQSKEKTTADKLKKLVREPITTLTDQAEYNNLDLLFGTPGRVVTGAYSTAGNLLTPSTYPTLGKGAVNLVSNALTDENVYEGVNEDANRILGEGLDILDVMDMGVALKSLPYINNLAKPLTKVDNLVKTRFNPKNYNYLNLPEGIIEQIRFSSLPEFNNQEALEVLNNFKQRIKTPEGQQRLKNLEITSTDVFDNLKIVADNEELGSYWLNKIGLNPKLPEIKKVTRHELEHAVQDARVKSLGNPDKETTNIDELLTQLELRKTPEKIDWDIFKKNKKGTDDYKPSQLFELFSDKQRATNYFDSGSKGKEKSAFLAEVQQYMMDNNIIPKDSYVNVTPEMVKNTFADAKFDETGGGKYLRLFNIIKSKDNNYELISKGLNKMLTAPPAIIGLGAASRLYNGQEEEINQYAEGGKINNDMKKKLKKYQAGGYLDYQDAYKGFGVGPNLTQDNSYYRSIMPSKIENIEEEINQPSALAGLNNVLGGIDQIASQGIGLVGNFMQSKMSGAMGDMGGMGDVSYVPMEQSVANNLTQYPKGGTGLMGGAPTLQTAPSSTDKLNWNWSGGSGITGALPSQADISAQLPNDWKGVPFLRNGGYLRKYQDGGMMDMPVGYPEYIHKSNVFQPHEIPVPRVHFSDDTSVFDMGVNLNDLVQMNGGGIGKYQNGGNMSLQGYFNYLQNQNQNRVPSNAFNSNSQRANAAQLAAATENDFMNTKLRNDRQQFADNKVDWGFMNWAKEPAGAGLGLLSSVPVLGDTVKGVVGDSFLTRTSGYQVGKGAGNVGLGTAKLVAGIPKGDVSMILGGVGDIGEGVGSTVGNLNAKSAMGDYNKQGYVSGKRLANAAVDFNTTMGLSSKLYGMGKSIVDLGNDPSGKNFQTFLNNKNPYNRANKGQNDLNFLLGKFMPDLAGGGDDGGEMAMGGYLNNYQEGGMVLMPEYLEIPKFKKGGLTPTKARQMLHDKSYSTDKQRKYFGYISSQKKASGGWIDTL